MILFSMQRKAINARTQTTDKTCSPNSEKKAPVGAFKGRGEGVIPRQSGELSCEFCVFIFLLSLKSKLESTLKLDFRQE